MIICFSQEQALCQMLVIERLMSIAITKISCISRTFWIFQNNFIPMTSFEGHMVPILKDITNPGNHSNPKI